MMLLDTNVLIYASDERSNTLPLGATRDCGGRIR